MAAFALGLLADKAAVPALTTALQDADPRVRGRAAEALGLDRRHRVGRGGRPDGRRPRSRRARSRRSRPTTSSGRRRPEADAVRLGLFALVRLKGYEPLAAAIQDGSGQRVGLVAGRLRAAADQRPARDSGAAAARADARPLHPRLRGARPRRAEGRRLGAAAAVDARAVEETIRSVAPSVVRALGQMGAPEAADRRWSRCCGRRRPIPTSALEAVTALAALKSQAALPVHPGSPHRRLADAARRGGAGRGGDRSGRLPRDPLGHGAGSALGRPRGDRRRRSPSMAPQVAVERLRALLDDQDKRVVPAVLDSAGEAEGARARHGALRAAQDRRHRHPRRRGASDWRGESRRAGAAALRDAYRVAQGDNGNDVREAVITALRRVWRRRGDRHAEDRAHRPRLGAAAEGREPAEDHRPVDRDDAGDPPRAGRRRSRRTTRRSSSTRRSRRTPSSRRRRGRSRSS